MNTRRSDAFFLCVLFAFALLLRLPMLEHPRVSMFDEGIYARFTQLADQGTPFFDIHPPAARLAMLVLYRASIHDDTPVSVESREPWGGFPYLPLRRMSAFLGALLPLVIYGIGRSLRYPPLYAALPSLLVALDNALILYSRAILPDMFLVVCAFASLFFALAARDKGPRRRLLFAILSGISLGAAIATKWTALGMLPVTLFALAVARDRRGIAIVVALAPAVYFLCFFAYQSLFHAGNVASVQPHYAGTWEERVTFPGGSDPLAILRYFPDSERAKFVAGTDERINKGAFHSISPLYWPLGDAKFLFWYREDKSATIRFMGDVVSWTLSFATMLALLCAAAVRAQKSGVGSIGMREALLLFGFATNYLPYFLIARPMYLYHYFVALVFLFLLVPSALLRLEGFVTASGGSARIVRAGAAFLFVLAIIGFVTLAPFTYGCSLTTGIACGG